MKKILLITLGCILGLYQPLNAQDAENVVNGHEYVDLALPSGLKWATCNVGAKTPEASGNCYAWGEIKTKDEYNEANSLTYGIEMNDISGNVQYDVAAANWGEGWRMPTLDEMQELIECCIWEWTKQNGIGGYNIIGPNGNRIFLPSSDSKSGSNFSSATCGYGSYWTSTPIYNTAARYLSFYSNNRQELEDSRSKGLAIRPVYDVMEKPIVLTSIESYTDLTAIIKTFVSSSSAITERGFYYGTNPEPAETDNKIVLENEVGYISDAVIDLTPNTTYYVKAYATNSEGTSYSEVVSFTTLENSKEYEYVDLGLPSGLKWAPHNIGATLPSEYGNYYAWGEVLPKETYTEANSETYRKPMYDISGNVQYDAATFNWGGEWRMPTRTEMQELLDNCTWTLTTQNGVSGYKVTSKTNGNSIFLPAAGYRTGASLYNAGSYGCCLSSSSDYDSSASGLSFNSSSHGVSNNGRDSGYSIRPVIEVVEKPTVSSSVENYTDLTAIIKTFVSSSAEITERGFYYGTNPEPAETDNKVVLENGVGYITKALLDLTPNTTYYIKSYATNSEGTSYSEVVSFTTLENPKEYEYVDLGLPSGLKWATHNIGATSPSEYGNYYAWGEVCPKETYTEDNSETYGKSMDDISGTQYDAATVNWGVDWRMPTETEMQELIDNCTWTWTTQKGVYGYKVTSKTNGNSIFLPAAGNRNGAGSYGMYWGSNPDNHTYLARFLSFEDGDHYVSNTSRYSGCSIRPVIEVVEKPTVSASVENYTDLTAIIKTFVSSSSAITERGFYYGINPEPAETDNKIVLENEVGYISDAVIDLTPNTTYYVKAYATNSAGTSYYSEVVSFTTLENPKEYEYVDLGLPSGLKWATHNIGATSPEEYGDYFAWGEVFTKDEYTEANSLTYGKPMDDISGTQYDAATINWGGDWRMPTETEMQELIDYCTCTWTTQNGVYGFKVTSKTNGNSIFLPAAGNRSGSLLYDAGGHGSYWSSVPHENGDDGAYGLHINSVIHGMYGYYRYYGRSVRPVLE